MAGQASPPVRGSRVLKIFVCQQMRLVLLEDAGGSLREVDAPLSQALRVLFFPASGFLFSWLGS